MTEHEIPNEFEVSEDLTRELDELGLPGRRFPIFPFLPRASGLYDWQFALRPVPLPMRGSPSVAQADTGASHGDPAVTGDEAELFPFWFRREELRLDVDGRYPQMVVSGTILHGLSVRIHWIANLKASGANSWSGPIWYKDGYTNFLPHTHVEVSVKRSWWPTQRSATIRFSGGGASDRVRTYSWKSSYFHKVEFEHDFVEGTSAVTSVNTCAHPNKPADTTCENLTIEKVFRRAGFDVTTTPGAPIPLTGAGANARWSDAEMHDAMQTFWTRFDDRAQWSMWVFFAALHEMGTGLGGIMFDDIGPNHRQGTAIFNDSFISDAPVGDPHAAAWIRRMRFWTAIHEMGHGFNLAHAWQKENGTPWIPLINDSEARSFMNYPFRVSGGQSAFFADFDFRFIDPELLFMRHAPERFVQMGNADWFDHHGFRQALLSPEPKFALQVRVKRSKKYFEFLEPVILELKLENVSNEPQLIDANVLAAVDHLTVILKKQGKAARRWIPYRQMCFEPNKITLARGDAVYGPLDIAAGVNGWDIAEPGVYTVQVALRIDGHDVVSNPLRLNVAPPKAYEEELLAQDFFSEDVGRILTFGGSMVLDSGNDLLRRAIDQFPDREVATHARLALAKPRARDHKVLELDKVKRPLTRASEDKGLFTITSADVSAASAELTEALLADSTAAADTFGHIKYKQEVDALSDMEVMSGEIEKGIEIQKDLRKHLARRGVLKSVLKDIDNRGKRYLKESSAAA